MADLPGSEAPFGENSLEGAYREPPNAGSNRTSQEAPAGSVLSADLKAQIAEIAAERYPHGASCPRHWSMEPCTCGSVEFQQETMWLAERIAALAIRAERQRRDQYEKALDRIASWNEGDEVTASFDEPCAAGIAREVLNEVRVAEYAQKKNTKA